MLTARVAASPADIRRRGDGRGLLGARRAEVLAHLRRMHAPQSVSAVAASTGLHLNTARFHLEGLVADGLAERAVEQRHVPGRPRVLYAAEGDAAGSNGYELLAEILAGAASAVADAPAEALVTGRAWGRHLVERPAPAERIDSDDAVARLDRLLGAVGFAPQSERHDGHVDVVMRHCPFREVADRHGEVVCPIHLGLMQGALSEMGAPVQVESLERTTGPCLARLRATTEHDPATGGEPSDRTRGRAGEAHP